MTRNESQANQDMHARAAAIAHERARWAAVLAPKKPATK